MTKISQDQCTVPVITSGWWLFLCKLPISSLGWFVRMIWSARILGKIWHLVHGQTSWGGKNWPQTHAYIARARYTGSCKKMKMKPLSNFRVLLHMIRLVLFCAWTLTGTNETSHQILLTCVYVRVCAVYGFHHVRMQDVHLDIMEWIRLIKPKGKTRNHKIFEARKVGTVSNSRPTAGRCRGQVKAWRLFSYKCMVGWVWQWPIVPTHPRLAKGSVPYSI